MKELSYMKSNISDNELNQMILASRQDSIEKLVVGAVIQIKKKFLLLERVANDFLGGLVELPSGTVDPGEGLLDALEREVKEETGLAIVAVKEFLGSFDYASSSGKKTRQFNFLVDTDPGEVKLDPHEHSSYHFVSANEISSSPLNISENVKKVLKNI